MRFLSMVFLKEMELNTVFFLDGVNDKIFHRMYSMHIFIATFTPYFCADHGKTNKMEIHLIRQNKVG